MAESRGMTIIKASDGSILFRAVLFDAANAKITAGTTSLRIWHFVPGTGAFTTFDFNDNTFKAGAITTPTASMTHQQAENSTYNTGVWSFRQATLTGFPTLIGDKFVAEVSHASLPRPIMIEFQYGDLEGDASVLRNNYATAGAASTITLDAGAVATARYYQGCVISILAGTGVGQTRYISNYTAARVATVVPNWITNPDSTSLFQITPFALLSITVSRENLATAGSATTITLDVGASATNQFYRGMIVNIIAGTGAGQSRMIKNYVGGTQVAAVDRNWATNPDNTSIFQIVDYPGRGRSDTGLAQTGAASSITLAATASAVNNTYNGQTVRLCAGTGAGQALVIIAYDGTTKIATVSRSWVTNPDNTTTYEVVDSSDAYGYADVIWDEPGAGHVTAATEGRYLFALGSAISGRTFNNTLNALLGTPDTGVTDTVPGQVWQEVTAAHNSLGTMGAVMNSLVASGFPTVALIADGVWDEDIQAAHGTVDTAGLLLRVLGRAISTRANNPNLNALLGVPDTAASTIAETLLDENISTHVGVDSVGLVISAVGLLISRRTNSPTLHALLDVADTAGLTLADPIWDEVLTGGTHNVANSAGRRVREIDDLTKVGGTGDLVYAHAQLMKIDQSACDSPATAGSLADKLDSLAATVAVLDREIITSCNIQGNSLRIEAAIEQYGVIQATPWDQCSAIIYDEANAIIANIGVGDFGAITARGFFQFTLTPHPLVAGATYQITVTIVDTGSSTTFQTTKLIKVTNV